MSVDNAKRRWYHPDQFDNDEALRQMIYDVVDPDSRVLDVGAGVGNLFPYELKNRVADLIGIDRDPRVEANPLLHRGIRADVTDIPIEDSYFDVVFSRYVLEHIEKPEEFLREMYRILKPGGYFIFLTPNKWHYVSLASLLTPHHFHKWYNRLRGRDRADTFPTFYRLNSVSDIRRQLQAAGFVERKLVLLECCPNYLTFCMPAFMLGVGYERLINSSNLFAEMRGNILGCFSKRTQNTF